MGCNVVWPLRRSAGIFAKVRIDLLFHHRLRKCAERLSDPHDVAAFRIINTVGRKRRLRLFHFDLAELQNVQHLDGSHRIALIGRNDESIWRACTGNGAFLDCIEVAQPALAVKSHILKSTHCGSELVIDNVAQVPVTAAPLPWWPLAVTTAAA